MKAVFILALTIVAINALSLKEEWFNFKSTHNKSYKTNFEEQLRFRVFQDNLERIKAHNEKYEAGLSSYYMGVNQFADMTAEEFEATLKLPKGVLEMKGERHVQNATAPASMDWREKNAVLEVRNQEQCGSCWAFASAGAIEGQNAIHHNKRIVLSTQQLLDCTHPFGNVGCAGGWITNSFKYAEEHAMVADKDYPYTGRVGPYCNVKGAGVVQLQGFKELARSEAALQDASGTVGPIGVLIHATSNLQFYSGGVLHDTSCQNSEFSLNHAVLLVGYHNEGQAYWIVKNSWGRSWGEEGYFKLLKGANQCGIALKATYPLVR